MKSVSEHNAEVHARIEKMRREAHEGVPTGLACEKCGAEMFNLSGSMVNMSDPPSQYINCKVCGHQALMLI